MSTEPLLNGAAVTKTAPKRLGPIVVLYEPISPKPANAPSSSTPSVPPPDIVLFFGWMGAKTAHAVKYVAQYQAMYPTAPVLLIDAPVSYMFRRWLFQPAVAPAMTYIQSVLGSDPDTSPTARPRVLVHACSNGGSALALALLRRYVAYTKASALPPHVLVFDSAPGVQGYARMVLAMSAAAGTKTWWQRLMGVILAHTSVSLLFTYIFFWRVVRGWYMHPFRVMWVSLFDRAGVSRNERARLYLYSNEDELIEPKDVEGHAEAAREKGFVVSLERFEGSKHVAHARLDPQRYWGAVRELWERASRASATVSEAPAINGTAKS